MSLTAKTERGLAWSAIERICNHGMQFVIQILLARILLPEEFGLIAIVMIFMALAHALVESGLGQALVQTKDLERIDVSTVFFVNLLISLVLYGILFFFAPSIATFFGEPQLTMLVRVLSISLVINALGKIHMSVLVRNLQFKKLFKVSTPSIVVSGAIGITMALSGYGVWALVGQLLSLAVLSTCLLWLNCEAEWQPRLEFSRQSLAKLTGFGLSMMAAVFLNRGYHELYGLVIGRVFSVSQLAFYNRARWFQRPPTMVLTNILTRVLFPVLSMIQDDNQRICRSLRRGMGPLCFVVFPGMTFLIVAAHPIVEFVLTEKWMPAADYLLFFPVIGMLYPLSAINLTVLRSKGKGLLILKLGVFHSVFALIVLLFTFPYGVLAIVIGQVGCVIVGYLANIIFTQLIIGYRVKTQLADIAPYLMVTATSGAIALLPKLLLAGQSATLLLFTQLAVFTTFYLAISHVLRLDGYLEVRQTMLGLTRKLSGVSRHHPSPKS